VAVDGIGPVLVAGMSLVVAETSMRTNLCCCYWATLRLCVSRGWFAILRFVSHLPLDGSVMSLRCMPWAGPMADLVSPGVYSLNQVCTLMAMV